MFKKRQKSAVESLATLRIYWQEVRKYKISFFVMLVSIPIASVILDTIVPYLISKLMGSVLSLGADQFYQQLFWVGAVVLLGVAVNLIAYQTAIIHEPKVRSGIARSVLKNLLSKDQNFFVNQRIGALTGKFIDFVNSHSSLQDLIIGNIAGFVINISLGMFLIWQRSPILALIVMVLVIVLIIQVRASRILRNGLRQRRKELVAESNGLAADVITNNLAVKTFASEEYEIKCLDEINEQYRRAYVKDLRLTSVEGSSRIFIMQVVQLLSIAMIGGLLLNKQIQLDTAIFTIIYLQRLSTQLFRLGEILFGYDKIMLQATPMTEILTEGPKIVDNSSKELVVKSGEVSFSDCRYAYEDSKEQLVLKNFNLHIPAGQKVGLVGLSGAGKTTVTKLLLRFDDLDNGSITIDGQDISEVTQSSLRRTISYVPQEPMLFHRSLRDNIAYGKISAADSEIIKAAKLAHAYDFIKNLPGGLDTIVGEKGVKLSGGQKQRIAIARSILKNAPILILDEATSALDSESESLIQKSLNKLMKDRTSLVIAHRLSTISKLDRIVVIDKGRIVEDGTHAELINSSGIYKKLWAHQSGDFIDAA